MDLSPEVRALLRAVETILDTSSTQAARGEAHEVCERFKNSAPVDVCVRSGFLLFDQTQSPAVRHFGLQLIQHCVAIRWDDLNDAILEELRQQGLALLRHQGDRPLLQEEGFVKHALSCFIVEMIKRLWPQAWPTLLSDLLQLAECGESQLEIVLMILQRLAQDVIEFDDHLPQKRRQELRQVLARECKDGLFAFLRQTLLFHASRAEQLEELDSAAVSGQLRVHQRLAQAVIETLTAYLEWVSFAPLFADDGLLLRVLCQLLLVPCLRGAAVECLTNIVQRKHGKVEERRALLVLFRDEPMKLFKQAASLTDYFFLKKLAELLTCLGTAQLSSLWSLDSKPCVNDESFAAYLDVLVVLIAQPSPYLQSMTLNVWHTFLESEQISADATFRSRLGTLLQLLTRALVKPATPFATNSPLFLFVSEDFSDPKEFSLFFSVFRGQLMQAIRSLATKMPHDALSFVIGCMKEMISSLGNQEGACHNPSSPVALRCDGILCLVESVMAVIVKMDPSQWPPAQICSQLVTMVIKWNCKDLQVIQSQLGMLEALYPFLQLPPNQTEDVLVKLLEVLVFKPSCPNRSALQGMQRRAGAAFVHLCYKHMALVFPLYHSLLNRVQQIWPEEELHNGERTNLIEGLVCASRCLATYEEQQSLLAQLLEPVTAQWQSPDLQEALCSTRHFVVYTGLHGDIDSATACRSHRANLTFCLNTFLAMLRRCELPVDTDAAKAAGYPVIVRNQMAIIGHPAWPLMEAVVPSVCRLLSTFASLWSDDGRQLLSKEFFKAFDMPLVEKALLLNIDIYSDEFREIAKETPVVWAQRSMSGLYDTCLGLLGKCCQCLGAQFYTSDLLMDCLCKAVLPMISTAPTYRLRLLMRTLLRPFALGCPPMFYEQVMDPFLSAYFTVTGHRLQDEWAKMERREAGGSGRTGDVDELDLLYHEEVVADAVVRSYAKDYLQAVEMLTRPLEDNVQENGEDGEEIVAQQNRRALREHILCTDSLCEPLLMTMLTAMVGPDRLSSFRGVQVFSNMLPSLFRYAHLPDDTFAQMLTSLLRAVHLYGQTPSNLTGQVALLTTLCEKFHTTHFSTLVAVLSNTLCTAQDDVAAVIQTVAMKTSADKKSRDTIKKLLAGLEGKATSQLFRSDIRAPQLPKLLLPRSKQVPLSVDDAEPHDFGLVRLCLDKEGGLPDDDEEL